MSNIPRYYYEVVLLRSSAPILTYASEREIPIGSIVSVPLKSTTKDAVLIKKTTKPTFETENIVAVLDRYYSTEQMEIAKFIGEYYFSSFSEAVSLFLPFRVGANLCVGPLDEIETQISSSFRGQTHGSAPT